MTKKAVIRTIGKIFFCLIPAAVLATGCAYQRHYKFKSAGMPEEVYFSAPIQTYYAPDIVVLRFRAPASSWEVGEEASMLLFSEMVKSGLGANIVFDSTVGYSDSDQLIQFARANKYEYIVTGDVLYYLNGGISANSCVEEEIKIYSVAGKRLEMVGHAKAVETARPLHSTDFVLVEGRGTSAPSAEMLMKRNAGKFARLLSGMFSRNGTTH